MMQWLGTLDHNSCCSRVDVLALLKIRRTGLHEQQHS